MKRPAALGLSAAAVLAAVNVIAGIVLGDVQRIPMNWGMTGTPGLFAPKWIGLAILPAISVIAMGNAVLVYSRETVGRQVSIVATIASIGLACQTIHLFLVWRYLHAAVV